MSVPITYKIYNCKSCDYTQSFSSRDPIPRPRKNLYKALVEHRYCNCCNELTQCFVSKGGEYHLGDLKNEYFLFVFLSEDYILKSIKRIEDKRKSFFYLFKDIFGKESARLAALYQFY